MTALSHIKDITEFLKRCDIEAARMESEIILAHVLGKDRLELYRDNPKLSRWTVKKIDRILKRRAKREPLQYILGFTEFIGLRIKVGHGVLIPRPETEIVVDEVIKFLQNKNQSQSCTPSRDNEKLRILDLCTGSGCIAVALAARLMHAEVVATDISGQALSYSRKNAKANKAKNVIFLKGSLFEPVQNLEAFDVIVSNPPYVRSSDIENLQPEIREWEPLNALDAGEDGLRFYKAMLPKIRLHLRENGAVFLEVGAGQADEVSDIARANGFKNVSAVKDAAGIDRVLCIS